MRSPAGRTAMKPRQPARRPRSSCWRYFGRPGCPGLPWGCRGPHIIHRRPGGGGGPRRRPSRLWTAPPDAREQEPPMTDPVTEITPEFQRGWDAALMAARFWHESQAKKALVQARRSRFPKNFEREAEVHQRSAEMITTSEPRRRLTTRHRGDPSDRCQRPPSERTMGTKANDNHHCP